MSKRKRDYTEEILQKIRHLETKLKSKKRCRIISSSSSEDEGPDDSSYDEIMTDSLQSIQQSSSEDVNATVLPQDTESNLDDETLALLGDAPKSVTVLGKTIHKDIAARWHEILIKGLSKEIKEKLLKEFLIPSNCEMLIAPKLNAEIKAAISENLVKRDNILELKQNQIGFALAALVIFFQSILEKDYSPQKLLKPISDACRILCDSHYNQTKTRRHFIISSINADMKETMTETVRDQYLFGDNVTDKLKSARTIKKSGTDLKQAKTDGANVRNKFNKNNFIKYKNQGQSNWRPLQRKPAGKADAGPRSTAQYQTRAAAASTKNSFQQRETAHRSPPTARRHSYNRRRT